MHGYYKSRFSEEYAFLEDKKKVIIHGFARGHQKIQLQKKTFISCYKQQYDCILLFHFGIPIYPNLKEGENQPFIMVFEGLPEDCKIFHLQSVPKDGGNWKVYDFKRSPDDMYRFEI